MGDYTDDDEVDDAGGSGGRPELPYQNNALEKLRALCNIAGVWLPSKGIAANLPNSSWFFCARAR